MSGGVTSCLLRDGMTRAPVVRLPSTLMAADVKAFIEDSDGFQLLKAEFDSTSRWGVHRYYNCCIIYFHCNGDGADRGMRD